jgi:periplasmic protein TonB
MQMSSLLHILNISTLAGWLSVASFGTVAVLVPAWRQEAKAVKVVETKLVNKDFTLGDQGADLKTEEQALESATPPAETLPAPPELPALAEQEALPEIPDLPTPQPTPETKPTERPAKAKAKTTPAPQPSTSPPKTARPAGSSTGKPLITGQPGGKATSEKPGGKATGMSSSARLAAGRMPKPSYPAEARRKGQTGTVTVEFTVDASGQVISAYAKSPSPWPLLNNEAVRTVRRWRFPAGGVMTLSRPIVFRLQ